MVLHLLRGDGLPVRGEKGGSIPRVKGAETATPADGFDLDGLLVERGRLTVAAQPGVVVADCLGQSAQGLVPAGRTDGAAGQSLP